MLLRQVQQVGARLLAENGVGQRHVVLENLDHRFGIVRREGLQQPGVSRDPSVTLTRAWVERYPVCTGGSGAEEVGRGAMVPPSRLTPEDEEAGSIIVVVATDAPLLPVQLDRSHDGSRSPSWRRRR